MARRILLALTLAVGTLALVGTAPPAGADHQPGANHWSTKGGAFHPAVDVDCVAQIPVGTSLCVWVDNAQRRWDASSAWGQTQWYGSAATAFGHQTNWIKFYGVPRTSPALNGSIGNTVREFWPDGHIRSVLVFVCGDCGLSARAVDNLVTHQFGHAIGLRNTTALYWDGSPSVMQDPVCGCPMYVTNHDIVALGSVYDPRFHNH